jgi:hypothetical protein
MTVSKQDVEREALNTADYRLAPSGQGPQADQWADKPHRLVYDLCSEVERLRGRIEALQKDAERLDWIKDAATSVSDGWTADGRPEFIGGTHALVSLCEISPIAFVPRESPDWFRAAIDAARNATPETAAVPPSLSESARGR